MSVAVGVEFMSIKSPNPIRRSLPLKGAPSSMALALSSSLRFESVIRPCRYRVSAVARRLVIPKGFGAGCPSLHPNSSRNKSFLAFAASHEESKHSEIEVERESDQLNLEAEKSQEAWKQTLDSFKEQALKMQSISREAYEEYSKKAIVILNEYSEQLKIQAEKARQDLSVIAKEISEEGKEYLTTAAENSPEPVKEIVETFSSSTEDLDEISKVRDFYLGIPYGLLLSLGGFLSFMLTGSLSAIRFGVILGSTLLGFSISSLKSYKRGELNDLALKGQAAIAGIIFLREIRLLCQGSSLLNWVTTFVSGVMVAFYIYRNIMDGKQSQGPDLEHKAEN